MKLRWHFGLVAAVFLAIFCLYPQFKMIYLRGSEWNGHYAYNDIDEVAYASYVRALIDGRPRKNDPYSGRDDSPDTPQPESLFSIQFAAPYTLALPARLLGVNAPWAMTLGGASAGFLAALAAFWLVGRMTGNSWFAMTSSLAIFAGGALAAGEGAMPEIFFDGFSYPYFPGFRRYIPALAIAAIFALFAAVWRLLERHPDTPNGDIVASPDPVLGSSRLILASIAIALFGYCVFSYFYVWTTAAAWLGCLGLLWLMVRPDGWLREFKVLAIVGAGCVLVLAPYAYLLSNRSDTMDHVQLLVYTRAPDLARVPEYISVICLIVLAAGVLTKMFSVRDRAVLFAMSFALVPLVVFNQQIFTGRSLQPIHYQVFIGNYVAMLALMTTLGVLWAKLLQENRLPIRLLCVGLAVAAIGWGFVECHYTVRVLDEANVERDLALPVAKRLEELSNDDTERHKTTVLAYDMIQSDDLPTVAPQNVLWARHQHVFAGLSWQESKERYYQFLHFSNVDERGLDYLLKNDFVTQIALFGWGRHTGRLSSEAKPLTYGEVSDEVRRYAEYRTSFDPSQGPELSYAVVND
ncbi:MAG TPA: hypothetical protein VJL58_04950, partial [Pyrinomonadaceae bacterium]|nr:hypothetical protein [Pyrinomonadaceae bacterium]